MASQNKNRREFHPAVSISSWLIVAIAIELASPSLLPLFGLLAAVLLLHGETAQRFMRLLWKARWLWLALAVLYAWTIPGTLLWPSEYSPSLEGLQVAFVRISRLVLMLAALARLLSEFPPTQLAGGLYLLAKPFSGLGLDRRALAVRLALTLDYLERPVGKRRWLEELKAPYEAAAGPEEIRLSIAQVGLRDMLVLGLAVALLGAVLFRVVA
jgi:hypothetical protein